MLVEKLKKFPSDEKKKKILTKISTRKVYLSFAFILLENKVLSMHNLHSHITTAKGEENNEENELKI